MTIITRVLLLAALASACLSARAEYVATWLETTRAWGLTVADFNNDGHDDLFISGHHSQDRIWYWTAAGYRPAAQVFEWVDRHDCDAADIDHNGRIDLYCAVGAERGQGIGPKEVWLQDASGVFHKAERHGAEDPYGRGRIPVFLDFNHDGWPDIYLANESTLRPDGQGNYNRLFINQGGARFVEQVTRATGAKGYHCVAQGDVNQDGWDDLLVCDGSLPGRLYVNNRAGDFDEWHTPANAGSWKAVRLADMNGDGRQDLVVLAAGNRLQVWLNTGTGQRFDTPVLNVQLSVAGKDLTVGDFNRDGWRDIYVVLSKTDCKQLLKDVASDLVFEGRSATSWVRVTQPQTGYTGCGHAAATLDGHHVLLANGGVEYRGPNFVLSWVDGD